jgi:hypothetical protein
MLTVLTKEVSRFRPLDIMSSKVKNTVRLLPFSSSKNRLLSIVIKIIVFAP